MLFIRIISAQLWISIPLLYYEIFKISFIWFLIESISCLSNQAFHGDFFFFCTCKSKYYISGFYPSSTGFDLCYKHCGTICWPFDCEWSGSHHGKLYTELLLLCPCNDHMIILEEVKLPFFAEKKQSGRLICMLLFSCYSNWCVKCELCFWVVAW